MRLDARECETGTAKGSMTDFDEYYEAAEPGRRERALGWATAIGLQQVDGLSPSDYLIRTARRNIEGDVGINVGINVGIKAGSTEELAVKAILRNPRITAAELARVLSVTQRQVERILATLKKTAGLRRQGARKNGEWRFVEMTEGRHG